ncbi:conserved hypothetical protein [Thiomonas delicata]|jgi:hypothetical protein|uniref:Uncharacterized protein n=1 Tax=Thiomonas delicata TaxID=364030 RepID=A0A238D856_THIDL|nr:conserved hypothetical protein [Thiomonas delicata]
MDMLLNWRSAGFNDFARGAQNHDLMWMTLQVLPPRPISVPLQGSRQLSCESETIVVRV